jgi:hypothetical protein
MRYLGIDPGQKGGVAFTDSERDLYGNYCMPATTSQVFTLIELLTAGSPCTVIIEKVQVMGKTFGAKAALSSGQKYGELIGICTALGLKIVEVSPAVWKRSMGLTREKDTSIALCERLFPEVDLLPTPRCTKPSDGMAEALLLAEYGRRLNL